MAGLRNMAVSPSITGMDWHAEMLRRLRDGRLALWSEAKALAERVAFECRPFTDPEQRQWEALIAGIGECDERIKECDERIKGLLALEGKLIPEGRVNWSAFPEERGTVTLQVRKLPQEELLA